MSFRLTACAATTAALFACMSPASANEMQVSEIEVVTINDGTANANAIYVRGSFTPALPCPTQGFVIFQADPFQKDLMAMLLMAKSTGRPVGFDSVYCHATGYARGNRFVLK